MTNLKELYDTTKIHIKQTDPIGKKGPTNRVILGIKFCSMYSVEIVSKMIRKV